MANLKEVKERIGSVKSTQQITKAMKMVAAAKLRRAQDRITQLRPYSKKLTEIIQNVSASVPDSLESPYAEKRKVTNVLLVVVTSDRGLCGAFNSSIFKYTKALIADKYGDIEQDGGVEIMPIGKKAYEYFKKRGYRINDKFYGLFGNISFDEVREAAEYVMDQFVSEGYDQVEIVFNEFKNVATQIVRNEQFLPLKGGEESTTSMPLEYIYEPSKTFIFNELLPKSLKIQFYKTILESNASENGARMTAMDKASENANELLKDLKLTYNRTRQAAITKEILEIVGGAEALAQS
ncbi:MAG: ATP synthase F1 subunit gamma [Bacteroidota bacterium]